MEDAQDVQDVQDVQDCGHPEKKPCWAAGKWDLMVVLWCFMVVFDGILWDFEWDLMGVSEHVVYYPKPNGFADHYPVFKNG